MGKRLKGCLIGCGVFVLVLILGVFILFQWFLYSSPVEEAGRVFRARVEEYKGQPITTRAEFEERLNIVDDHFDSPTFDKMRGGTKRPVKVSDIEKLFGPADVTHTNNPLHYVNKVHQYHIQGVTLNFHEGYGEIREFVVEDYTGTLYDEEALDQLFLETVQLFNGYYNEARAIEDSRMEIEEGDPYFIDAEPTRIVYHNTWNYDATITHYYDDGLAEFSPEEYLSFNYESYLTDQIYLNNISRRRREGFELDESIAFYEDKLDSVRDFSGYLEEEVEPSRQEEVAQRTVPLGEIVEELGDYAQVNYHAYRNELMFYWYFQDANFLRRVAGRGEGDASIDDFSDQPIMRLRIMRATDTFDLTEDFIGSRE